MLKNNVYNVDKEFDYATIIVSKSLQKIVKELALKNISKHGHFRYYINRPIN